MYCINHALESMQKQLAEAQTKLETVGHQIEMAKAEVTKPFAQEAELAEKLDRLSALNALLNMDEKGYVADKPRERVSLKEKLEAMKVKASGGMEEKITQQKAKGKEETL
jgi:tagatose-1,6-bisphosphate aldolase